MWCIIDEKMKWLSVPICIFYLQYSLQYQADNIQKVFGYNIIILVFHIILDILFRD